MGKKSVLTKEYQEFLNLVKANRSAKNEKNFFDFQNVLKLKNALDEEIKSTKEKLQRWKDSKVSVSSDVSSMVSDVISLGEKAGNHIIDPENANLEDIKKLRKDLEKNEYTPFLKFAKKSKQAIKTYLDVAAKTDASRFRSFVESILNLYDVLWKSLEEYRHTAKSHHYFKSSVGRAEIANKSMGGSLESWLHHSMLALDKVGTEFSINENFKYVCRKATPEEEAESDDNKGRPKFLRYKHVITEIVPKTK